MPQPMRVVYLTHYADLYGANRSLVDLAVRAREAHGVVPHVIAARDGPLVRSLAREGVPCRVLPFSPWMTRRVYMGGPHHRVMQHWREWRSARERAAHNTALLPDLADQCRAWGIGLLHVNSSVIGLGAELSRTLDVPWVWHVRELPERHYGYSVDGGPHRFAAMLRRAGAVIAVSDAVRKDVLERAGTDVHVHVVPNGVAREQQLAELRATANERWRSTVPFRFALVGLFHPAKGQVEAVEAFAQLRAEGLDVRLDLAGNGRAEAVLRRIGELRLGGTVELRGYVDDPFTVFRRAHCALVCSRYEAMGRAAVEAMASGIPVIGHASGATPEWVKEGRTGLLFGDGHAPLADRMRLLARDPALARHLGETAMADVAGCCSVERMANSVAEVYRGVLGG